MLERHGRGGAAMHRPLRARSPRRPNAPIERSLPVCHLGTHPLELRAGRPAAAPRTPARSARPGPPPRRPGATITLISASSPAMSKRTDARLPVGHLDDERARSGSGEHGGEPALVLAGADLVAWCGTRPGSRGRCARRAASSRVGGSRPAGSAAGSGSRPAAHDRPQRVAHPERAVAVHRPPAPRAASAARSSGSASRSDQLRRRRAGDREPRLRERARHPLLLGAPPARARRARRRRPARTPSRPAAPSAPRRPPRSAR